MDNSIGNVTANNQLSQIQSQSSSVKDVEKDDEIIKVCDETSVENNDEANFNTGKITKTDMLKADFAAKVAANKKVGLSWGANIGGAAIGAAAGLLLGPAGLLIGGVMGGLVGNALSSKTQERKQCEEELRGQYLDAYQNFNKDISEIEGDL